MGRGPSVGGQRPRNNNFTVDGVDNNSKSVTGAQVVVPNDAVQEFTVLLNQFQAEYGHSSGGQFNIVVRTGTNDLHGMLYDYMRNRNLRPSIRPSRIKGSKSVPATIRIAWAARWVGRSAKTNGFTSRTLNTIRWGRRAPPVMSLMRPPPLAIALWRGFPESIRTI